MMAEYGGRDRLQELWRQIDDAHFSYLETDDSPEKLEQRKKLEVLIKDFLCVVPPSRRYRLAETWRVLRASVAREDFSAYRAAHAFSALAQYAANLLSQPWRTEYKVIRLYCGYYKHEVDANIEGGESMLRVMGYKPISGSRMELDGPICPDIVAAVSRDSLIAYVECQIMKSIWEELCSRGFARSWGEILKQRAKEAGNTAHTIHMLLSEYDDVIEDQELYSNVKPNHRTRINQVPSSKQSQFSTLPHQSSSHQNVLLDDENIPSTIPNQYMRVPSQYMPPNVIYSIGQTHNHLNPSRNAVEVSNQCPYSPVMVTPYGMPYYYGPVHPYMMQTPVYAPIKHANTLPINGFHTQMPQQTYGCNPIVPTAQLIELDPNPTHYRRNGISKSHVRDISNSKDDARTVSNSENKNYERGRKSYVPDVNVENFENSRRNSAPKTIQDTNSSTYSVPRSDTQPCLSKAREDGVGTFGSWDYVFRNLENQNIAREMEERTQSSPTDRESKTLDRHRGEKYDRTAASRHHRQTTMDLEEALQLMSVDKSCDELKYRAEKAHESVMRLKSSQGKKTIPVINIDEQGKTKSTNFDMDHRSEHRNDELMNGKDITDKTRLLTKEEVKERREMQRYMNGSATVNGRAADIRKLKKTSLVKCLSSEKEREVDGGREKPHVSRTRALKPCPENGMQTAVYGVKSASRQGHTSNSESNSLSPDPALKSRLVVSLDTDQIDGTSSKSDLHWSSDPERNRSPEPKSHQKCRVKVPVDGARDRNQIKWECGTCTYLNNNCLNACEICGKSKSVGPEVRPLTSGGRECPACTLVNRREASACEACNTSLKHSPTYI